MMKKQQTKHLHFDDLHDGEHFYWGAKEHVKTARVVTGVSVDYPLGTGYSNAIRISDGQVSGMGDLVEVSRGPR
jgi:hypothetical protein